MNDLIIQNAHIITPDQVIEAGSLHVRDGQIYAISPALLMANAPDTKVVDAGGKYLLPGIIDIHTDAIEKEISPRPGANFPVEIAFRELERRMSGCGITTVFHSIYLGYYAAEKNDPVSRQELFERVAQLCHGNTLIHNLIHLRFEVTGVEAYDTCLHLIEQGCVDMLSFMDHTPGQGQYGSDKYMKYLKSTGLSEEDIQRKLEESLKEPRLSQKQLQTISALCEQRGIPIASHDDDHPEKVAAMHALGASICEFPINLAAARKGVELGMHTVGGASNVLRGGSLSDNLHVQEAIEAGAVDTLCSDYYPPSLLHALFKLIRDQSLSIPEAIKLATLHPAEAARIAKETGSIAPGKDADLILVDVQDGTPWVTHTFLRGKQVAQAAFGLTTP